MSESESKQKKCYPRIPNTHVHYLFENTCIACSKPYDPASPNIDDCSLILCPCALVLDVVCCIPMIFGLYNITLPTNEK